MKRNVILMVVGIVMAMMLSSCAQGAPADITGKWDLKSGTEKDLLISTYSGVFYEIKDNGEIWKNYIWATDGHITNSGSPYYTIKTNSCGELDTEEGTKFKYEVSGDNLTLKIKSGSGLVDALLDDWAVCKKRK